MTDNEDNSNPTDDVSLSIPDHFLEDTPEAAADQADAILYFMYLRAKADPELEMSKVPRLLNFIVKDVVVEFSDEVEGRVRIRKQPDEPVAKILTPRVAKDKEEERELYLLSKLGELSVRFQKEAILNLREMLSVIMHEHGKEALVESYRDFKRQNKNKVQA